MQTGNAHLLGIGCAVSGGVMKDDFRLVVDVSMNAMSTVDTVALREPACQGYWWYKKRIYMIQ